MKIHPISRCVVLLTALVLLTACERPASVAPLVTDEVAFATPTPNPAQLSIAQTQTAAASILPDPGLTPVQSDPATTPDGTGTDPTAVEIIVTITPTSPFGAEPTVFAVPTLRVPVSYELKEFESPYCIARRFNLDIGELLSTNRLTTDSRPPAGTTLYTPGTGHRWASGDRALLPHPTSYTIKAGDTLSKVACLYGDVSPEAIIVRNNLQEPYQLMSGQLLEIP